MKIKKTRVTETEVEIRKQTTEAILSRLNVSDADLERWRVCDQS